MQDGCHGQATNSEELDGRDDPGDLFGEMDWEAIEQNLHGDTSFTHMLQDFISYRQSS